GHGHAGAAPARGGAAGAWSSVLAVGVRPCSGAIIILVFALSQGLVAAGIAATLVMAVGTGLTVALLATLAVAAKDVALRLAGGVDSRLAYGLVRTAEIGAALCVLLFGLVMLGGALAGGLPGWPIGRPQGAGGPGRFARQRRPVRTAPPRGARR